ncbi:hypothetical protein ACTHGP_06140 [[Pasteurella] aerogenes]
MIYCNQTIFNVAPHTDLNSIKSHFETHTVYHLFRQFIHQCLNLIGKLTQFNSHPYRMGKINYTKVKLSGIKGKELTLTFIVTGYTEFPTIEEMNEYPRYYVYVADAVDCYWFIRLLKEMLLTIELPTKSVDNPLENNKGDI